MDAGSDRVPTFLVRADHALLMEALASILRNDGFAPVGPVDPAEAIELVREQRPRLALVDAAGSTPGTLSRTIREMTQASPFTRVIVVAPAATFPICAVEASRAGAAGTIDEGWGLRRFLGAVRAVSTGSFIDPPDLSSDLLTETVSQLARVREREAQLALLTAREREVVGCLLEGMHSDQIADRLGISARTVDTHVNRVLRKLDAHSRLELVAGLSGVGA